MAKEPLNLVNFDNGQTMADVNAAIAAISAALDAVQSEKAKGEITIKLVIQDADDSGDFRTVKADVKTKLPSQPPRASLFPIQQIGGKRMLVVDSTQVGDQLVVPGVATGGGTVTPIKAAG